MEGLFTLRYYALQEYSEKFYKFKEKLSVFENLSLL